MLKHKYLQLTALVLMVFAPMSWGASSVITDQEFLKLCKEGTEQEIIAAINSGANVNAEGNLFDSSDFLGVKDSNNKMSSAVRLLVKLETAVTPLNIVAGRNMPDAVRALVKAGAEVNFTYTQNGRATTLYAAVENDNTETLQILLDAGGDVTITLFNGGTVLAYAASINQNPEVIKMLLKAGADVNAKGEYDKTVLMLAAEYCREAFSRPSVVITKMVFSGRSSSLAYLWTFPM